MKSEGGDVLRFAILSLSVWLVLPAMALAQKTTVRALPIQASIDDSGKVVPVAPNAAPLQRIDDPAGTGAAAKACPAQKPMNAVEARALVEAVATREQFYPDFVLAVAKVESNFDVKAVSDKGAVGLMQLEPSTATRYKVDICDPADNVLGGVRYLRELHDRYHNPMFILSAYNAGEEKLLEFHGIPPYPETVKFIANVLNEFYVWPDVAASASGGPRRVVANEPRKNFGSIRDLAPPRAVGAADAGWTGGFVKNFDE